MDFSQLVRDVMWPSSVPNTCCAHNADGALTTFHVIIRLINYCDYPSQTNIKVNTISTEGPPQRESIMQ